MIEHVQGECKDQRGNTIEFDLHYDFTKKEIVAYKKSFVIATFEFCQMILLSAI